MSRGASVVTANKALLADDGAELYEAADRRGVDLYFEATVAGAIPLLRPLRESLAGDNISRVLGIVNGTTNYILTKMDETGACFDEALAEAQALGYAEADPTADVEGFDAAAKAAILAGLAFHTRVTLDDVYREGITRRSRSATSPPPAPWTTSSSCSPSASARADGRGVSVRVHPAMVPRAHPLAGVREAYNAVFVEAEAAGQLMFYGRGAGGAPTASAVLGDLVAVGRNRLSGGRGPRESAYADLPGPPDRRGARPATTSRSTSPTRPACSPPSRRPSPATTCRSRRCGRTADGDDAALVIVTHRATESRPRPRRSRSCAASTSSARSPACMRVGGRLR